MFKLRQLLSSEPLPAEERERVNLVIMAVYNTANELLTGQQTADEILESWRKFRQTVEELGAQMETDMPFVLIVPTTYKSIRYNFCTGEIGYR